MTHIIIFKADYGHLLKVEVNEYDELTGVESPSNLAPYTSKWIIGKKPNDEVVYLPAVASGINYLISTIPSGFLSLTGFYQFTVILENALQRFHSTEFGFDVTIPKEQ
jgi:hypothetical protein